MSADTVENSPPPEPAVPGGKSTHRWRQRGRRGAHSGTSLVARGESMVWLTAGSLAICLVMIVGLLTLIFARGVATFWPGPILRFELLDGTVHLGEVAGTEEYTLTEATAANFPPEIAEAARGELGEADEATVARRLIRTGNYRLTNSHFDWVDEFAIAENGETAPEWAMVLERLEWGNFYGFPKKLEVAIPRPASGQEDRLADAVAFLETNLHRLPDDLRERANEALAESRDRLAELRAKSFTAFHEEIVGGAEAGQPDALRARLESGEERALDEVRPSDPVASIVRVWSTPASVWRAFDEWHEEARERYLRRRQLEKHDIGLVNRDEEEARLDIRAVELDTDEVLLPTATRLASKRKELAAIEAELQGFEATVANVHRIYPDDSPLPAAADAALEAIRRDYAANADPVQRAIAEDEQRLEEASERGRAAVAEYLRVAAEAHGRGRAIREEIDELKAANERMVLVMETAQGQEESIVVRDVVRAYPANRLDLSEKWGVYLSRWWEFVSADPRYANQEGGVFPAIWGTVVMTIVMSLAVVPFGVLAALYLREYAKSGPIVSAVRIAVNNLAGVPSIVFGVFGLGFFCYIIGAYVDGGPENAGITPLPEPSWWLAVTVLAVTAVAAFLVGLSTLAGPVAGRRTWWSRQAGRVSLVLWVAATILFVLVIAKSPYFDGLYEARLPNPTFGKGGLLWASLTLALLTLPVVIVATEEALAAVPNSMREGSYACGASKWQTIKRIVLPRAMPGITTGMILAMARGAGEVAPLMLVGALKIAPELPVDAVPPFVHLDRSFMHLGFHVFDLGFHSPNSDAAKPMVFTTTLLLIVLIALLNLAAIALRARLRKRFATTQF